MRALITGITGFVGSHLAEHLLECGDHVCGLSRLGSWPSDVPLKLHQHVPVWGADLSTELPSTLRQHLTEWEPEVVYHLAAISVPSECGEEEPTSEALATNVAGTRQLIDLALSFPRPPRLVFSGSCYVYGTVNEIDPFVSEDSPTAPLSGYGRTKLAAEQALLSAARDRQLDVIIARAFQHTGPRQSPRMIVPDWAQQLTATTAAPIRVICLDTYIDLSDVRDIVRGYRLLAVHGKPGRIYNVGSGVCRRSGDLWEIMRRIARSTRPVIELAPGHKQHPIAKIRRMENEIHWQPVITIERTLEDVLAYWYDRIRRSCNRP